MKLPYDVAGKPPEARRFRRLGRAFPTREAAQEWIRTIPATNTGIRWKVVRR